MIVGGIGSQAAIRKSRKESSASLNKKSKQNKTCILVYMNVRDVRYIGVCDMLKKITALRKCHLVVIMINSCLSVCCLSPLSFDKPSFFLFYAERHTRPGIGTAWFTWLRVNAFIFLCVVSKIPKDRLKLFHIYYCHFYHNRNKWLNYRDRIFSP